MSALADYFRYYKKELLMGAGYFFVLISIPMSFFLAKETQIFRSQASEIKPTPIINQQITAKELPASSPLEELKKTLNEISQGNEATGSSSVSTTTTSVNFGSTLSFKVNLEGRSTSNQSGKVFVGIASGSTTTKPTYLLTFTVDISSTGSFSGLSLAGLTVGSTYTAYLKGPGQIDSAIQFTVSSGETSLNKGQAITLTSGDLNEDNTINSTDLTLIKALYGTTPKSSNWNPNADFNGDSYINQFDINYVTVNLGKTGASGVWQSAPQTSTSSGTATGSPSGGRWIWIP